MKQTNRRRRAKEKAWATDTDTELSPLGNYLQLRLSGVGCMPVSWWPTDGISGGTLSHNVMSGILFLILSYVYILVL